MLALANVCELAETKKDVSMDILGGEDGKRARQEPIKIQCRAAKTVFTATLGLQVGCLQSANVILSSKKCFDACF